MALQSEPQNVVVRESMEEALEASKVFEEGMINDFRLGVGLSGWINGMPQLNYYYYCLEIKVFIP